MKIAVITDDGKTVSAHFGRARYYLVVSLEDGRVVHREMVPKSGHHTSGGAPHIQDPNVPHGTDPESHKKHEQMASPIMDCEALIAGGMGMGAYQSLESLGVRAIVTDLTSVDGAIEAYVSGTIKNRLDKLH